MTEQALNLYGDHVPEDHDGRYGVSISSQRRDWLDEGACRVLSGLVLSGSTPRAMDLGCGDCAQALRMASLGAHVTGVDLAPAPPESACAASGGRFVYIRQLVELLPEMGRESFDVVLMQRSIHYVRPRNAIRLMDVIYSILKRGGHLFVSASGLNSELGCEYPAQSLAWAERFHRLSPEMAQKHRIFAPVCLYDQNDLRRLIAGSGLSVEKLDISPFGNIKSCAVKP